MTLKDQKIDILKIKEVALDKKSKIMEIDKKVISTMRFFNISDDELKTYSTLLSLGYTDLSILSSVMNMNEKEVHNALKKLKKCNWIVEFNGGFRPISPHKVFKDELNRFKASFKNIIDRIKSGELKDIEDLFLQNNFMYIRYNDYIDSIP